MKVVIVVHGSRDPDYIDSVRNFANNVGVLYAFNSLAEPSVNDISGDVYVPLFVGYGKDYDNAVAITGYESPPLLEWPGIKQFLLNLGPGLYVFHGENDQRFLNEIDRLGLTDVAFLKLEPLLNNYLTNHCPNRLIPVILARGSIYKEILTTTQNLCPNTNVLRPLFELREFMDYFRGVLPWLIRNTRCLRC